MKKLENNRKNKLLGDGLKRKGFTSMTLGLPSPSGAAEGEVILLEKFWSTSSQRPSGHVGTIAVHSTKLQFSLIVCVRLVVYSARRL